VDLVGRQSVLIDELQAVIAQQQLQIAQLEARMGELELLLRAQTAEGPRPAPLVVDDVQLLRDGRSRRVNGTSARPPMGLKKLSGELEVPVLALVHLNRNGADRSDKHPTLTDLRESGDLENTADSVIGLYREEMDHPETTD